MTSRLVCYAVMLALFLTVGSSDDAWAQSADERAAELNEEGKDLWLNKKDLKSAAEKFRQATTLSPQPQYFFNLCYALHQLGQFAEARTACRAVSQNGGDEKLRKKAKIVLDDIAKRIPDEPEPVDTGTGDTGTGDTGTGDTGTGDTGTGDTGTGDTGTGDTGTGDTGTGDTGTGDTGTGNTAIGDTGDTGTGDTATGDTGTGTDMGTVGDSTSGTPPGPIPGLYQPAKNPDEYNWALGADAGFMGTNLADGNFGGGGLSLKGFIEFAALRNLHAGGQIYATYTPLGGGAITADSPVSVFDIGGALFKNIRIKVGSKYLYLTPLIGAHFSILSSADFNAPMAALGIRGEVMATWLLGSDRRHAIRGGLAINVYRPYQNDFGDEMTYGVDSGSLAGSFVVGYALRFTTPFGKTSLITLE